MIFIIVSLRKFVKQKRLSTKLIILKGMSKKLEHIGIAVRSIEVSSKIYNDILEKPIYKTEEVLSEKVKTAFFDTGNTKIELLEPLSADSAIAKFIAKRGEGIHHMAFRVENINHEVSRLLQEGYQMVTDGPKKGADNMLIAFLHPNTTGGVLIELCQPY